MLSDIYIVPVKEGEPSVGADVTPCEPVRRVAALPRRLSAMER